MRMRSFSHHSLRIISAALFFAQYAYCAGSLTFPLGNADAGFLGLNSRSQEAHGIFNLPRHLNKANLGERFHMAKAAVAKAVASKMDFEKYPKLFAAGGFCASLTHLVTVPLDVVKTRLQVNPGEFTSLNDGIRKIYEKEGPKGLMQGMTPTFCGFLMQGALKYGFYEFFKDSLAQSMPAEKRGEGGKLPIPQMIIAASAAEILGTTALLPFESARIRMVADPKFANNMFGVLAKLVKTQGLGGIYGGYLPIQCKQVPFTITQFLVYEFAAKAVYSALAKADIKDASSTVGTGVTLGCGLISGITASLVSQPGDTVLSVMNKAPGTTVLGAIKQLGPRGLYLGAGARCVHVTSYIVAQFLIYDSIKRFFGIPVAGEAEAKQCVASAVKK
uniref:Mitochondrial phosphate carrier protein n=1 Tax=Hanusia phi TaxID=3032 RepID=A0A7S0EG04_9CRYP|mmetsp:Transcript_23818/g.53370  ORF Transcript_23818/g.53370 Transcript_23818/m.53370 type:complete len:389 (+) Transcript_23818:82-1248(+)